MRNFVVELVKRGVEMPKPALAAVVLNSLRVPLQGLDLSKKWGVSPFV